MKLKLFKGKITTAYLVKLALLTAISYILYMFVKFNLPFMFPSFLDMQFSELPAILAGFSLGPVSGVLIIVLKCLLKIPFSSTAGVGELIDIAIGIAYVLPASLIYWHNKSRKNAIIGFVVGTVCAVIMAILFNRFVAIPFYVQLYFGGNFNIVVSMCQKLYKNMTADTFYLYYLGLAVLPFNILRSTVVSVITFLVYKRLSKALHWEPKKIICIDAKKVSDPFQKIEICDIPLENVINIEEKLLEEEKNKDNNCNN